MGHPTMQENDTAKLTPTFGGIRIVYFIRFINIFKTIFVIYYINANFEML
ncbi:hypothetical protein HMPREF1204_04411 [Bacteroides fragilis HMW 615]|nr:hypothetical protein HMPREF1204_04411 [Bacteroides fragilis HMW 615]